LTELVLYANQIRDISPLKNLTKLTELNISENKIVDISPLKELKALKRLNIAGNQISDIIVLKDFTNLINLYIRDCPDITDEQVAELQKALPNLKIER